MRRWWGLLKQPLLIVYYTPRNTIRRSQRPFVMNEASNEQRKRWKKRGKKAANVFGRFHSLNPQTQTLCNRSTERNEYCYYLLQKLLQLNSKLWSIAITSFDQYLLFNRSVVVYVVRSSSSFSLSLSPFRFLFSYRHWCNEVFPTVFDNEKTFDLTVRPLKCALSIAATATTDDDRKEGAFMCDVENGRSSHQMHEGCTLCNRLKWIAIQFSQFIYPTRIKCVYWCGVFGSA